MAKFDFEFSFKGIQEILARFDPRSHRRRLIKAQRGVGELVKASLVRHTPKRSGFLASQYVVDVVSEGRDVVAKISNPTFYGPLVNLGSGIFVGKGLIRPTTSKVLRFVVGGQVLYRRSVRGQKGQFFVQSAVNAVASKIPERVIIEIQKELNERA